MLSIYFGEKDNVMNGPAWFRFNYEAKWLSEGLVSRMIRDIDKSEYQGGELIMSDVLGPIPPERLSGGLQTLICIYNKPELMFNATSCGENCAKWLLEMGKDKDISINLRYFMPFENLEPFEIRILNEDKIVMNMDEYTRTAIKYV
ncbi:MAG: DUF4869 domain-containing protein [Lachnospiraceae bacterium]|nr:DUF4869 domain-containing protein [Lachnospiraceae bacterium]